MIAELQWRDYALRIDFSAGRSLALILDPHGAQPSFFAGTRAQANPLRVGDYVGDVALGGSCNAEVLEYVPHCHGTHTECRAHLDKSAGNVLDIIDQQPCLARLITMQGTAAADTGESYRVSVDKHETLLTLQELLKLQEIPGEPPLDALLIRTLPNEKEKMTRDYALKPCYPVFSNEAINWLADRELKHLLLDTPSLDRANDGGQLGNHRRWWGMDGESKLCSVDPQTRSVTEMMYVPDDVNDGYYWLHLELQPLAADATSSRPIIYPVEISSRSFQA